MQNGIVYVTTNIKSSISFIKNPECDFDSDLLIRIKSNWDENQKEILLGLKFCIEMIADFSKESRSVENSFRLESKVYYRMYDFSCTLKSN